MRGAKIVSSILKFLVVAILIASIMLIVRQVQGYPVALALYGACALGLILVVGALRFLTFKGQRNLLMLFCSTLMTLYMVEFFLFFVGNPFDGLGERGWAAMRSGVEFDKRKPLDIVDELAEEGVEAYPFIAPSNFIFNMPTTDDDQPIYGLSNVADAKTVYCNEDGQFITYESDRYGFNNPDEAWDGRPLEIVIVGDSFAQGACVDPEKNIAGLLRQAYPKTVSVGANGNGPLSTLASVKEYVGPTNPDVLLWFYFEGNDMGDLHNEKENEILMNYLESDFTQDLINRQDDVDAVRQQYVDNVRTHLSETAELVKANRPKLFFASLKLYQIRLMLGLTMEDSAEPTIEDLSNEMPPAVAQALMKQALRSKIAAQEEVVINQELVDELFLLQRALTDAYWFTNSWEGEIYFIYIPDFRRFNEVRTEETLYRQEVLSVVENSNVTLIDLHPVLHEHPDPLALYPFRIDGHFNEDGYKLVADTVLDAIADSFDE